MRRVTYMVSMGSYMIFQVFFAIVSDWALLNRLLLSLLLALLLMRILRPFIYRWYANRGLVEGEHR
ncbi:MULTISPECIES: hypothetical protein [unclassified Schaalia]|uniref:hypothetical protein n=1 Tax=unclassified Schaalia TaxID=2691889 RepID=UPI001E3F3965|nr:MULTISPECIES: hypothetical protein [unclassified Schaalia]MCD4557698.1 hypothetical protein [Schaalia sp. lx-100]